MRDTGRADVRARRSGEHRPLSPLPGLGLGRMISPPTVETVGYFRDVPGGTKRTVDAARKTLCATLDLGRSVVFVPPGTSENSPAIYCWVSGHNNS